MIEVEAPDGTIVEFPDGTDQETIRTAMSSKFPAADVGAGTVRSFLGQGVALGFGDEIEAFVRSKVNGTSFDDEVKTVRAELDQFRKENPNLALGSELAGAFATALVPGGAAASAARFGTQATRAALGGAAVGAISGAGAGEGAEDRLTRAGVGAVTGGIGGRVGAALTTRFASKSAAKAGVSGEQVDLLKRGAQKAFQTAEDAGFVFSGKSVSKLVDDATDVAGTLGEKITPKSKEAIDFLNGLLDGRPITFSRLAEARTIAKRASLGAGKPTADDITAGKIVGVIDEFMDDINFGQLTSATPAASIAQAKKISNNVKFGRELWRRFRNSEMIAEAIERAEISPSAFEKALKSEFRTIAKRKPKSFNKKELDAVRKVAGLKSTEGILSGLGAFSPEPLLTGRGNKLFPFLLGGATVAEGIAPGTSALIAGTGAAAKRASQGLTQANVRDAGRQISQGLAAPRTGIVGPSAGIFAGSLPATIDRRTR
jgi:hypothetical protein